MSRANVRRLFIGVLVLLPAQYALVGVVGAWKSEPWPALIMPAFQASDLDADGALTDVKPELTATFASGERVAVPVRGLLQALPPSHHPAFLAKQCRPAALSGTAATEQCRRPAVRRWLQERVASQFLGRTVRRLDVTWTRLRYTPGTATLRTMPLDTLTLDFGAR